MAQPQVQLPLRRDFPFVLHVKGLALDLGLKGLALKARQQCIASGIGGGASFLPVALLQIPARSQGVGCAQQAAVLAGLSDAVILATSDRTQLLGTRAHVAFNRGARL